MNEYFVALPGNLTARFKSACEIDKAARLQFGAYVPGFKLLHEKPQLVDFTVEHKQSNEPRLEDNGDHVILHAAPSEKLPADIYHLFYGVARRAWLKQGLYPVHAAAVGKDNQFTLLAGPSGAGKTTLARILVDGHGLSLYSGNKTLVKFDADEMKLIAGTKTMTALDRDLNRYAYEIKPSNYADGTGDVGPIAIVRVNDGVEEHQKLKPQSALHTLYPMFLDAVNAYIVVNGKDVFDGALSLAQKQELAQNLAQALQTQDVHKISGSIDFMARKILRL